jgi:hypothetical protein
VETYHPNWDKFIPPPHNPKVGRSKSLPAAKSFEGFREFLKNKTKTFQREPTSLLTKKLGVGMFGKESSCSRPGTLWRREKGNT